MIPNLPYELQFTKSAQGQYARTRSVSTDRQPRGPKALSLDEGSICQKFSNGAEFSPIIVVSPLWLRFYIKVLTLQCFGTLF